MVARSTVQCSISSLLQVSFVLYYMPGSNPSLPSDSSLFTATPFGDTKVFCTGLACWKKEMCAYINRCMLHCLHLHYYLDPSSRISTHGNVTGTQTTGLGPCSALICIVHTSINRFSPCSHHNIALCLTYMCCEKLLPYT